MKTSPAALRLPTRIGLRLRRAQLRFAWFAIAALAFTGLRGTPAAEFGPEHLAVMTFNLRYASSTPPNSWQQRRPVVRACIEKFAPDLIGTQEGLFQQIKDLAADLQDYDWIGLGRDGGSRGEFMAVFYRKNRFEPLEFDHYWLSDTPSVIASTTWGHSNRRMVTWVRFLDRHTGKQFRFLNTHFDHEVQEAREKSAQLIRDRAALWTDSLPALLVGDFNANAKANKTFDILTQGDGFTDSWDAARERRGEIVKTFHGFRGPAPGDGRIDWILFRGPFKTEAAQIITFSQDGQYPSDHFPVMAWLKLENP